MNSNRIVNQSNKLNNHGSYIMTSSFRVLDNHALSYTINAYDSYDIIIFRKPLNIERHDAYFEVIKEDLVKTLSAFTKVHYVNDLKEIFSLINGDIILDKAYLNEEKSIEKQLINFVTSKGNGYTVIESNVTVPVSYASNKEEYSARTIRSKIHRHLYQFIDPVLDDYPSTMMEKKALRHCYDFIENKLSNYHLKNHPELDFTSELSVYLKYGIISPIRIYILLEDNIDPNKEVFLEELIVRRELAYNFVYYNHQYDNFSHITYEWAYNTMEVHKLDMREYLYTIEDYIQFNTHDPYFNAAMKEMVFLGKMHGYMRMYWCKKIIEWSPNYKFAYDTAIYLNNYYFYDGYTPNGFTGVAWCFGKHDRAWTERDIFGKLRYMNANGLKRKFNIDDYVKKIENEVSNHVKSK
ncbi:deoxyribodipyrimidine photolyase [Candidatus Izemoplasma sp. B36]|uniref:deoxyribodipyrimidine photolyase n=1 Tax=Candidatus Izemoplasma sp. B36 TaxID=3242468 RepID=UPI0035589F35